ncbi:TPA: Hsp20/alpha crystallin family protein [Candidatus Bathyarchaeota archaeon]|nr:Hsp20/alpha crystallin family protein [Candidatus Bathyarchaeota archaeon]
MSAKWRRSKKLLKWQDLGITRKTSKPVLFDTFRRVRKVYPQKYRLKSFDSRKWKEPKPLIDIFQESNCITIVAEIAGFNKETLKIEVKDQKLTLSARAKDRKFYKSLNLPKVVIPNGMHTTYKNGVLEVRLRKAVKEETIKKQVG